MRLCVEARRFKMQAVQAVVLRDGEGAGIGMRRVKLRIKQQGDRSAPAIAAAEGFSIERDGHPVPHAFRQRSVDVQEPAGTRVGAAAYWKKPLLELVRYFCELGMKRSAWRDAYRI